MQNLRTSYTPLMQILPFFLRNLAANLRACVDQPRVDTLNFEPSTRVAADNYRADNTRWLQHGVSMPLDEF